MIDNKTTIETSIRSSLSLNEIDSTEVHNTVVALNKQIKRTVSTIFAEELRDLGEEKLSEFAIFTTGSDGRREKFDCNECSPLEVIVVFSNEENPEVVEKINSIIQKHPTFFYERLFVNSLSNDNLLLFNNGKEDRLMPARAIDSRKLFGSKALKEKLRETFFEQVKKSGSLDSFKKKYCKFSESVLVKHIEMQGMKEKHFDVDTGEIYFDGNRIKGVKYPLFRPIQYKIVFEICKGIQAGQIDKEQFLSMPKDTVSRLQWLRDNQLTTLTQAKIDHIKKAYSMMLLWYKESQSNFTDRQERVMRVNPEELFHVCTTILSFAEMTTILAKKVNKKCKQITVKK